MLNKHTHTGKADDHTCDGAFCGLFTKNEHTDGGGHNDATARNEGEEDACRYGNAALKLAVVGYEIEYGDSQKECVGDEPFDDGSGGVILIFIGHGGVGEC